MLIRELNSWPPAITDSHTFRVLPSDSLPATLKRCGIYTIAGEPRPYLSLVVEYQGRDWHAMIQDLPEALLRRLERTLQANHGRPLAELGDIQVLDS